MNKKANIFDFYSENFDRYFEDLVEGMTPAQRMRLPDGILNRLFTNKKNRAAALEFREKAHILSVAFGKRIVISIEDEKQGIPAEDYQRAVDAQSGKITNTNLLGYPRTGAGFIMADKNLMNSMMYLNHVYTTEIYSLLRPLKISERSKKDTEYNKGFEAVRSLVGFILNYEMFKKRLVHEFDFSLSEIYAILYFSTGEKTGLDFYKKDFRYSYNANSTHMFRALGSLTQKGYLSSRGRPLKYSITARGLDVLNKIAHRIISFNKI